MDQGYPEKKPIKRSEYIVALSRDHHTGLLFCWKIKEGLKRGIDLQRINNYVKYFWEQHLSEHFREEEILLFDKIDSDLTRQAKNDHEVLKNWVNRITSGELQYPQDYFSFTELLINHVRFEERVLFPNLEAELPKETLEEIGAVLAQDHQVPFNDTYYDEFWVKKD